MEANLTKLCWEKIAEVSTISIEGTLSIVLDNTEVILVQIDKVNAVNMSTQCQLGKYVNTVSASEPKECQPDKHLGIVFTQ